MPRHPVLSEKTQRAVRLIANADAGFTQEDLASAFGCSRFVIARVLSRPSRADAKKENNDGE